MSESKDHIADEKLHEYLDGELPGAEQAHLQDHVHSCVDCSMRLDAWAALFGEIEQLPDLKQSMDFEPLVLDQLVNQHARRNRVRWLLVGQGVLTLLLLLYGWREMASRLPLTQLAEWLTLPVVTLEGMIHAFLLAVSSAFDQFITWSLSSAELVGRAPQIPNQGTLLGYGVVLVLLFWFVSNRYLLRVNGQPEDVRP